MGHERVEVLSVRVSESYPYAGWDVGVFQVEFTMETRVYFKTETRDL